MDDTSSSESENEDGSNKLSSIFNDPYATNYHTADGKRRWRCEWCKKDFAAWNATKALYHLIQKRKVDIAPCHAKIDQESMKRYMDLYNKRKDKIESASRKRDMVTRNMEATNIRGAVSLESSRNKRQKTSITNSSFASTIKTSKTANSPSTTYSTPTITSSKKNKQLCQMKVYGGASVVR